MPLLVPKLLLGNGHGAVADLTRQTAGGLVIRRYGLFNRCQVERSYGSKDLSTQVGKPGSTRHRLEGQNLNESTRS